MEEKLEKNQFRHPLIEDIWTCLISFIILVVFIIVIFFLNPILNEELSIFIFGIPIVFVGSPAAYYFIISFIRIIGWLFRKEKWAKFEKNE